MKKLNWAGPEPAPVPMLAPPLASAPFAMPSDVFDTRQEAEDWAQQQLAL